LPPAGQMIGQRGQLLIFLLRVFHFATFPDHSSQSLLRAVSMHY
jgi:hypothetical protein